MPPVRLDRFQRVRERDRWGLGDCVDALDTQRRDAPVVLKRLPPVAADQRERVEAALRSLEPLRHSTIVPVEGYGFDGDVPFLVVEPVEGRSLRAWIDEHDTALRWPELSQVRALFDGVCAAVAVAHRMRALAGAPVLHGLLSPESVMISRASDSESWDVSVMDFALSTLPGVLWSPSPGSAMSDPRAPEQLSDPEAVSAASDVFSLGVLLASMLVPFAFPVRPRCWAHFVEEHPAGARSLLSSMRADVPGALYDELVKALSLDPRERHADADRLRTAMRRVSWEPVAEIAPPPRFVEHAEPKERERDDGHSRPMMRLPSALMADLGPSPMNLRASVPTQKMFNSGLARPDLFAAPPPPEPTDTGVVIDPPSEGAVSPRSFESPSATTTVDALLAFRHIARGEAFDEASDTLSLSRSQEHTDALRLPDEDPFPAAAPPSEEEPLVPENDLFSGEFAAQETVARRPAARVKPGAERDPTRALMLSPEVFGALPAEGVLVAGVKLQSLVLKAPPRPPERHEETRVRVVAPAERDSLPGETPSDPWADGAAPPPAPPPPPQWVVAPRQPTMAPPGPWGGLPPSPAPMVVAPPPQAPMAPAAPPSSLRWLLVVVAVVGFVAFSLGALAGR
ncbi:MAG: protein kinase [Deltaproteobacteria bacterium]|nr:protein kinase [Deltaproteobacteria bacterium]